MKKINDFISDKNTLLESYFQAASHLLALTALLKQHLPVNLKPYCQVANYKEGCLIIQTDNAGWATQLRYMLPELQKKLQMLPEFKRLKAIRYYVAPSTSIATPARQRACELKLSAENAQLALNAAEHIDGELGEALRKIALHAEGPKND